MFLRFIFGKGIFFEKAKFNCGEQKKPLHAFIESFFMNIKNSLINNINHLSLVFATGITIIGAIANKPYLTTTGLGISGGMVSSLINKKFQYQQQKNQTISQNSYLINEIDILKAKLKDSDKHFLQQQENLQNFSFQHQEIVQEAKQLSFQIRNVQNQLKNHNKKLKKHQHDIQTQKSNQNKIIGNLQKLNNKQQKIFTNQSQTLNKIKAQKVQLARVIEITQNNSAQQNPSSQTILTRKAVSALPSPQPQTFVYIDNNNLYYCLKAMGIKVDYQALMIALTPETGQVQFKLYDGAFAEPAPYQKYLKKLGYQVYTFPVVKRIEGNHKTIGDDVQLALDMVEDVQSGDRVILVTGDGDFYPAVEKIKQRQVHVTLVAKKSNLNRYLKKLADRFISLDAIKYNIAQHTKLSF